MSHPIKANKNVLNLSRSPYHAPVAPPYGHHGHHKSKREASAGPKYGYG